VAFIDDCANICMPS